jgi:hypothetical protein
MKTVLHDDNVERGLYPLNSLEKEVIRPFLVANCASSSVSK